MQSHVVAKISHELIVKGAFYRTFKFCDVKLEFVSGGIKKSTLYIIYLLSNFYTVSRIYEFRIQSVYDVISFAVAYCDEYKIVSEIFSINDNVQFRRKVFFTHKDCVIGRRGYETGVRLRRAAFSKLQIHVASP